MLEEQASKSGVLSEKVEVVEVGLVFEKFRDFDGHYFARVLTTEGEEAIFGDCDLVLPDLSEEIQNDLAPLQVGRVLSQERERIFFTIGVGSQLEITTTCHRFDQVTKKIRVLPRG